MAQERFIWSDFFSKKNHEEKSILHILKQNTLFHTLSGKELALVVKVVHLRHYEPSEQVFGQYERGLGMYMIAKGGVEIRVRSNKEKSGPETLVASLDEGSFFGELALIEESDRRTASAYAKGPTTLIGFFKPDLMDIIERKPEVGVKILMELSRVLGKRLTETLDHAFKEKA